MQGRYRRGIRRLLQSGLECGLAGRRLLRAGPPGQPRAGICTRRWSCSSAPGPQRPPPPGPPSEDCPAAPLGQTDAPARKSPRSLGWTPWNMARCGSASCWTATRPSSSIARARCQHLHRDRTGLCPCRSIRRSARPAAGRAPAAVTRWLAYTLGLAAGSGRARAGCAGAFPAGGSSALRLLLPQPPRRCARPRSRHAAQPERCPRALLPGQFLVCAPPLRRGHRLLGTRRASWTRTSPPCTATWGWPISTNATTLERRWTGFETAFALEPAMRACSLSLTSSTSGSTAPAGAPGAAGRCTSGAGGTARRLTLETSACSTCWAAPPRHTAPDAAQLPSLGRRRGQGHRAVRHQPGGDGHGALAAAGRSAAGA